MARYVQVLNAGDGSVLVPWVRWCADPLCRPTTACSERGFAPPLMLSDAANHVFTFPNFVMTPGQTCRVYTNENHPEYCGFNYDSGSAIWNNSGDTATLRDSNGTVVDTYFLPGQVNLGAGLAELKSVIIPVEQNKGLKKTYLSPLFAS